MSEGDFRRRAESALTHSLTIAVLGVLLLNDLLFKSLWPGSWFTGKLSDLAWLVFALPLLAFLLSFLARGNTRAQRISFLAAYTGLPLLYVAFNTFDPVHDWIMRGISLAGGSAGSPRDATDSLVIPLAWGIALWVWRRAVVNTSVLRRRWALLVADVASLASIATDRPSPVPGVKHVGTMGNGEIVALTIDGDSYYPVDEAGHYIVDEIDDGRDHHRSVDGGMTWSLREERLEKFPWGDGSAYTPRGRYTLDGSRVMRVDSDDGQGQVAYSTTYLQEDGNGWIQNMATKGLDERWELAAEPQGLVYDEKSGNLVFGLGIQGVVVGKPDGEWVGVPVGRYTPTDFTFWTKTRLLTLNLGFWITALTISVSMTAASLILSQYRVMRLLLITLAALAVCVAMVIGIVALVALVSLFSSGLAFLIGLLSPAAIVVGALAFGLRPRLMPLRDIFLIMAALVSLLASVALLGVFGVPESGPIALMIWLAITAWVLSAVCFAGARPQLKYRRVLAWSIAGMTGLVLLPTLLWLHLGLSNESTKTAAIVLCGLAAIVFAGYVRRTRPIVD